MNNDYPEGSGLETTTTNEFEVRARAPKAKKGDTRRLSMSGVMSTVRAHYDVPSSPATVKAIDGSEVRIADPIGAAVTYLNQVERVQSAVELSRRDYLQIEYNGVTVRFGRRT